MRLIARNLSCALRAFPHLSFGTRFGSPLKPSKPSILSLLTNPFLQSEAISSTSAMVATESTGAMAMHGNDAVISAPGGTSFKEDDRTSFVQVFETVVSGLLSDISKSYDIPPEALAYIERTLTYNVPHGKLNRGLAVYQCYLAFRGGKATEHERLQANLLGWCIELLQAFFLVADDIMDSSHTRRGQTCFYRLQDIGLKAINDSLMLESMIYRVLRIHFREHPAYIHLLELFQDITYTTEIGQLLDLTSQQGSAEKKLDLDRFTEDMLARIYKYKTSHYSFYLPVALGMRLASVDNPQHYETAKAICLDLGHYFQAQDDFLDAFGDPEVTGKVGTDIEENTCTWLVIQALKVVNPEQRQILQHNYGRPEPQNVQAVKQLYRDLKLPEKFAQFEQESFERIKRQIEKVSDMPRGAFEFLLAKIYKRSK